jgi:predicted RND superfamily exporter protein
MAKDFGGGISEGARKQMTKAIHSVRNVVTTMEKVVEGEHVTAEIVKEAKRSETPTVRAKIKRVNDLITKKRGVLQDALASFTKTVNDLKGDVTALEKSYRTLPRKQ